MNEVFLLWGFGLFGVALVLFIIELFLPTGGVIGVLVGVAAISGVVAFFRASTTWGVVSVLFLLVVSPIAFAFALKVWPNTPVGRRLILGSADDDDEGAPAPARRDDDRRALLGATGTALTDLRPVGTVRIEGQRLEALAEGGVIEAGRPVRITAVEGARIKVRAAG
ncbi:MAG: hypothetical protein D6693_00015 [Planctomycetota bacterium]|nr:MAG: hypothetical protein D6693_00015 [Planctomycetota bacterium]